MLLRKSRMNGRKKVESNSKQREAMLMLRKKKMKIRPKDEPNSKK